MLQSFRSRKSGVLLWVLMAMLVVGLAGFGVGVGGGLGSRDVAAVGDQGIPADVYARAMEQQLRDMNRQTGQSLTMEQARAAGLDRQVLAQLLNEAALDGEATKLGLSASDARVRAEILTIPAFRGAQGFDATTYRGALERTGFTPASFEATLRADITRTLVGNGIASATRPGDGFTTRLLTYAGEARTFDWLRLDAAQLTTPIPAPTDADLTAEHDAHPDRYTRPETQTITYASMTPDSIAATIEIPEEDIRAAYAADPARFSTPERRILDRIGFATTDEAAAAKARLDAGETDFDKLAAERGLTPAQIEQGEVTADSLAPAVRDAVFGASGPGIVGPVESPLGPSLYRINGILAARTTRFEEARDGLARELALKQAGEQVHDDTAAIEDLIASGATLEEIASETGMELGSIALSRDSHGGLADDPAFRKLAADAVQGEETDLAELAGGGLVALRLESTAPAAVIPLAEIRDQVAADWTAARTADALAEMARGFATEIGGGLALSDLAARLGLTVQTTGPVTRGSQPPGLPESLLDGIFAAPDGGTVVEPDGAGALLARVTTVTAFDPAAPANAQILEQVRGQVRDGTTADLMALYTTTLRDRAGVEVNQRLIDTTLARFP